MNIINRMLNFTYEFDSIDKYAFILRDERKDKTFLKSVRFFLKSKDYLQSERRCNTVYSSMLGIHDKFGILKPSINQMLLDELYGLNVYPKRRLHYTHQANVFLLGWYLYHNLKVLRNEINKEIERTTKLIKQTFWHEPFRYSGGSLYGEFLYRWRLTSLCHDMGTGIQQCEKDLEAIRECIQNLNFNKTIDSLDELNNFQEKNILKEIDTICKEIDLSGYIEYQKLNPYLGKVFYDHGIFGSIVFLRHMFEGYSNHKINPISVNNQGDIVYWHPDILTHSISQISLAIALHNLDQYKEALIKNTKTLKIFDLHFRPLFWLLKISDTLQEWNKPHAVDANMESTANLEIEIVDNVIMVKNFPENKLLKAKKTVEEFTNPANIITFE